MDLELINKFYNRLGVNVDFDLIEKVVMSDRNILRPIVGHAFEYIVADAFKNVLGGSIIDIGGDTDIDLILIDKQGKRYTAQVKTLRSSGIKQGIRFDINLHKTHGVEARPNNLYPMQWPCPLCHHEGDAFPDFLILPHPENGILIVPKDKIPESRTFPGHYADPAIFDWDSEWLNRWDLVGFPEYRGKKIERRDVPKQPFLNHVCQKVKLTFEELLTIWLKPSNFRMIDMNLKGNLREPALQKFLEDNHFQTQLPIGRYPKYDIMCEDVKIQIKGTSKSKTIPSKNLLGVEVMGSHGKGSIRRYSTTDFDYLGIVIEPECLNKELGLDMNSYHFCFIPINDLPLHYRNGYEWDTDNKLYDVAAFSIVCQNGKCFLKPSTNYLSPPVWINSDGKEIQRKPVCFRNNVMYQIDYIPFSKKSKK